MCQPCGHWYSTFRVASPEADNSGNITRKFAGSSGVQQTRTLGDDMIPSDAEVVPVEGVFRTGKSWAALGFSGDRSGEP